ncbi:SDR family oxidoreductase [Nitriliruptoraceae bacterium ZYF776]|nr:SDR family oxidoreductase [Profundirhabdus halotolerans]
MAVLDRFDLSGRTALVTGATRGLGHAFARALAEAGADIAVVGRDAEAAASVVAELRGLGRDADAFLVDVTDRAAIERTVGEVVDRFGAIDVLVNNAGACIHRPALEVTEDDWSHVLDTNLTALWNVSQIVGARMVEAGKGSIVNIGSISAMIVNRPQFQPAYNASKAAVHQLTRSLAAEWAPHGVRVNAMAPGYIKTDMSPVDEPQYRRMWIEDAPMQRYATPDELGGAMVFLASDASSFVTGSVMVLDGGYTLF